MQKAELANLAKSQFLAHMSHELRTPMNAILGMLQLLQKTPLSSRQWDYTRKTEGAARSLLGLLNDILDFSKVEAGKMSLATHPFRTDALLRELSVILSGNLGRKHIELVFDIDPALPPVLIGDALRLQQVLINLGGNAIKFTEQGEVVVALRVLERRPGGCGCCCRCATPASVLPAPTSSMSSRLLRRPRPPPRGASAAPAWGFRSVSAWCR